MKQAHDRVVEGHAWSAEEWHTWVTDRVEERAQIFRTDPDEMVSAFNREIGYTRDYHGREILELLQNADDEGTGELRSERATIVLSREGLCFANTGKPFSAAGIKSLMISDNSPKKYSQARYIGNRGLGFRSVLSWTECPFILSGNLSVGFDRARARNWLGELAEGSERVRRKIEQVADNSEIVPIPTLALPGILDDHGSAGDSRPSARSFGKMWSVAQGLREQGYDTVIALPFTTRNAFPEAQAQVTQTGREVILFLRSIEELVIRLPDKETVWTARGSNELVEIASSDSEEAPQTWEIHSRDGTVPPEYLKADQKDTADYEMRLAVPQEEVEGPGVLFSHFPTLVRFPFPLIAHVTLELTNNRQYLVDSPANEYLLKTLAQYMAELAETTAADNTSSDADPWQPLSLIAARGELDLVVQNLGFHDALIEAARPRRLVPVRDGRRLEAEEARLLSVDDDADWLPDLGFEDVVLATDAPWLLQMVGDLGTPEITEEELRERLNRSSPSLSISARAALIVKLTEELLMPEPPPDLLLDSQDRLIPGDAVTHLPP